METVFLKVQEAIAEALPELRLIDEDCGQLDALVNGEDQYPVLFPCVLIGRFKTVWKNEGGNIQSGQSRTIIRLAFDCYDDTHRGSGTQHKAVERMAMNKRLYKALQGGVIEPGCKLSRVEGEDYTMPGNIKVYETTFGFNCLDRTAALDQQKT